MELASQGFSQEAILNELLLPMPENVSEDIARSAFSIGGLNKELKAYQLGRNGVAGAERDLLDTGEDHYELPPFTGFKHPRVFTPNDEIKLPEILPFSRWVPEGTEPQLLDFGNCLLPFPPSFASETLDLLFDSLSEIFQLVIFKESITSQNRVAELSLLCHHAELLLQALCRIAQLAATYDDTFDFLISFTEYIWDFLSNFSFSLASSTKRAMALELGLVARTYFCVCLSHLPHNSRHLRASINLMVQDLVYLCAFKPQFCRVEWDTPFEAHSRCNSAFARLARQLFAYLSHTKSNIFTELLGIITSVHADRRLGDGLWLLLASCSELLQFDDMGLLMAPRSNDFPDSAWDCIVQLCNQCVMDLFRFSALHVSTRNGHLVKEPEPPRLALAKRCFSFAWIFSAIPAAALKDLWNLLTFYDPELNSDDSEIKYPSWLFKASKLAPGQERRELAAELGGDDSTLSMITRIIFVSFAKSQSHFRANGLLTQAASSVDHLVAQGEAALEQIEASLSSTASDQSSRGATRAPIVLDETRIDRMTRRRCCLGITTITSVLHATALISPANLQKLWSNNIEKRLLAHKKLFLMDLTSFSALMKGLLRLVHLIASFPANAMQAINFDSLAKDTSELFVAFFRDKLLRAASWDDQNGKKFKENPEYLSLFRVVGTYIKCVDDLFPKKDSQKEMPASLFLDVLKPYVIGLILKSYSANGDPFTAWIRSGVVSILIRWLKLVINRRVALTPENRDHIVSLFGPFEAVIIQGTKSFDTDLIPVFGKCIAIFSKVFTDNPSLKPDGHISKLLPRISVSSERNRMWLNTDSATRTLPISFIIQIMRLPPQKFAYEKLKWVPVSVWIHSLMEFKVSRQYDLLEAILQHHKDADVKGLFDGIDMGRVEQLVRAIGDASSTSRRFDFRSKRDLELRPVLLRQFLVNLRRLHPPGKSKVAGLDTLFLDLPQLFSRIMAELEDSTVLPAQKSEHRSYMSQFMFHCAAICPHLMFDPVNFSACPMSEILSLLEKANDTFKGDHLPHLHYFFHGLAQTGALVSGNAQASYWPRFLAVLNSLLATVRVSHYDPRQPACRQQRIIETISKSISPPPTLRVFSLYSVKRPASPAEPQPPPGEVKEDPVGPTTVLLVEGLPPSILKLRNQVLSAVLPSILRDRGLTDRSRVAISCITAQLFSNLFSYSCSTFRFGQDLLCFAICFSDALSSLSHTGRDLNARLGLYIVLSRALEKAQKEAKRWMEAKSDSKPAVEKAFVLIAHHISADCYNICATSAPLGDRDLIENTYNELLTLLDGLKIRAVNKEFFSAINKIEWLKGVTFQLPTVADDSRLRTQFVDLAFTKIARFMQTFAPANAAFDVLESSLNRLETLEPRESSDALRKIRHEILTALHQLVALPLAT